MFVTLANKCMSVSFPLVTPERMQIHSASPGRADCRSPGSASAATSMVGLSVLIASGGRFGGSIFGGSQMRYTDDGDLAGQPRPLPEQDYYARFVGPSLLQHEAQRRAQAIFGQLHDVMLRNMRELRQECGQAMARLVLFELAKLESEMPGEGDAP